MRFAGNVGDVVHAGLGAVHGVGNAGVSGDKLRFPTLKVPNPVRESD